MEKILTNPIRLFLILGLIEGLLILFLVPMGKVPDDVTHWNDMQKLSGLKGYEKEYKNFIGKARINAVQAYNKVQVNKDRYFEYGLKENKGKLTFVGGCSPTMIKYLPGILGMIFCSLFNPPILIFFLICKFFGLIFYLLMGTLILKIAPYKKYIFLVCLLMPMTVQQCASINADAVLIPVSFLYFALILKYRQDGEEVGYRRVFLLLFLLAVMSLCKIVYIVMGLFVFLIPLKNFNLPLGKFQLEKLYRKYWPLFFIGFILLVILALYLFRGNGYIKVLLASMRKPRQTLKLFGNTIPVLTGFYIKSFVGDFGYLEVEVSILFVVIFLTTCAFMSFFQISENEGQYLSFSIKERLWMIFVMLVTAAAIIEAHLSWSFYVALYPKMINAPAVLKMMSIADMRAALFKLPLIYGVQGRYFIPTFPAVMMALSTGKELKHAKLIRYILLVLFICMVTNVCYLILQRYWI